MTQDITSLIEKLEGVEGPSIALDAEICWTLERDRATSAFWRGAMGLPRPLPDEFSRLPRGLGMASLEAGSPNYTASLDAALALAERVLTMGAWDVGYTYNSDRPYYARLVIVRDDEGQPEIYGRSATPALAICAAILKAHQHDN